MKNIFTTLLTLGLLLSISVQAQDSYEISTNSIDEIYAMGPFKIYLIPSDRNVAEIDLNGIDEDDIEIDTHGDEIHFGINRSSIFGDHDKWDEYVRVNIYHRDIEYIKATMGAEIKTKEKFNIKYLDLEVSMGAIVDLEVECDELDLSSSMGGEIDLTGRTNDFFVSSNMGSVVDAKGLIAREVVAKSNMGGEIKLFATEWLEANANFGGVIVYYGNPEKTDKFTTMGGAIVKKSDDM